MSAITANLQVIGSLKIVQNLGFNGMFATFQAQDQGATGPCAMVAVHKSNIIDDTAWRAFMGDVQSLADHNFTNVCPIIRIGEEAGHFFATYQWLAGRHLGNQVRDGGLPDQATSFRVIGKVATALAAIHRRGVAHRVLSPASIFIGDDEEVRLLHAAWGRMILASRDGLLNPAWGCITPFVAPEVAAGKDIDESADVYALGANLYFLITGMPPFWDDDPATLLQTIQTQRPDFSALSGLPPDAREVIEDMMVPASDERPVNLPALSDRLLAISRRLAALQSGPQADSNPVQQAVQQPAKPEQAPAVKEQAAPQRPSLPNPRSTILPKPSAAELAQPAPAPAAPAAPLVTVLDQEVISAKARRTRTIVLASTGVVAIAALAIVGLTFVMDLMKPKPATPEGPGKKIQIKVGGKTGTETAPASGLDPTLVKSYDETERRLRTLAQLAIGYQRQNGGWPAAMEELRALGASDADFNDAWEREIDIRGAFLVSAGANGKWDDDDDMWWDAEKNLREGYHPVSANQ